MVHPRIPDITSSSALSTDLHHCDRLVQTLRNKYKNDNRLWFKCMLNNVKTAQTELRHQVKTLHIERQAHIRSMQQRDMIRSSGSYSSRNSRSTVADLSARYAQMNADEMEEIFRRIRCNEIIGDPQPAQDEPRAREAAQFRRSQMRELTEIARELPLLTFVDFN